MSSFFYLEVSRPFVPLADLEKIGAFPAFQETGKSYNNKFRTGCRIVRTDFQNACLIYIYIYIYTRFQKGFHIERYIDR